MHAVSYAYGREKEGTLVGDIEAVLCECIFFYIYGKICGILEIFPRSLKNAINIPEERHLGLASLDVASGSEITPFNKIHKPL